MKKVCMFILMAAYCSVATCQTAQQKQTIEALQEKLKTGHLSISEVLTNKEWMALHSLTAFRKIIKENARPGNVQLTHAKEPGLKMKVRGSVADKSGRPMRDVLVYVYQTSSEGWYADTAAHIQSNEGDFGHARLFGYLKTDDFGEFEFESIRPEGYPNSDLPAHIHIQMWAPNGEMIHGMPGELLFEEDKRLTPERKKRALQDGYLVSKNTGTKDYGVYKYDLRPR
ncbi:MAG: hypothetical protein IPL27_13110 [Lewinellaceae bacterium]|nr:hypothetical protein [Lewinellaceae bacterium]